MCLFSEVYYKALLLKFYLEIGSDWQWHVTATLIVVLANDLKLLTELIGVATQCEEHKKWALYQK